MNKAWICYPQRYYDEDEGWICDPVIEFEEPPEWKYNKVIPIAFAVLKDWNEK